MMLLRSLQGLRHPRIIVCLGHVGGASCRRIFHSPPPQESRSPVTVCSQQELGLGLSARGCRNLKPLHPGYISSSSNPNNVIISRVMQPDDANPLFVVHGGIVLHLIEEAGTVLATRYCNGIREKNSQCIAGLVHLDRTDFKQPVLIGDVAQVEAEVTYTSAHSLQVHTNVWAESTISMDSRRLVNSATSWYVPVSVQDPDKVMDVPPLPNPDPQRDAAGRANYEAIKENRLGTHFQHSFLNIAPQQEPHTVGYSLVISKHLVHPSQCGHHGYCKGGTTMLWMDECAGMVAIKHCHTQTATVTMDTVNFHKKVECGSLITLTAMAVFTSARTLEVLVTVDAEQLTEDGMVQERVVDAYFSFVSLDKHRNTLPVPKLELQSPEEEERFEAGRMRNKERKRRRERRA